MAGTLRAIFDEDAELYEQARPRYPDELIAELANLAGIRAGALVAEIGAGTGQATLALADLGAHVTRLNWARNSRACWPAESATETSTWSSLPMGLDA